MTVQDLKVYRASQRIASENKSCPGCSQRIRVGMPVVFCAPSMDLSGRAVAHHRDCAPAHLRERGDALRHAEDHAVAGGVS